MDPVQLYISIAALSFFYLGNNATLSVIFGRDLLAKEREGRAAGAYGGTRPGGAAPGGRVGRIAEIAGRHRVVHTAGPTRQSALKSLHNLSLRN